MDVTVWAGQARELLRIMSNRTAAGIAAASAAAIAFFGLTYTEPNFQHIGFLWIMSASMIWGVTWHFTYSLGGLQRKLKYINSQFRDSLTAEQLKYLRNTILIEHRHHQTVDGAVDRALEKSRQQRLLTGKELVNSFMEGFTAFDLESRASVIRPLTRVIKSELGLDEGDG